MKFYSAILQKNGFDNFRIGGGTKKLKEVEDSRIGDCFMAKDSQHDDVEFQIMNNKIAIISSMNDKRASYNGIKKGDSEEKIYEKSNSFSSVINKFLPFFISVYYRLILRFVKF